MCVVLLRVFLLCLCGLPISGWSASSLDSEIMVELATAQKLPPFFIGHFSGDNPGFPVGYMEKLEKILENDLALSGYVTLVPHSSERDLLINRGSLKEFGFANQWKALQTLYVLNVKIQDKTLAAALLIVNNNTLQALEGFPLTGDLGNDRKQIHRLSDAIIKSLFSQQGIATTHLLYTRKYRDSQNSKWVSELWECDYDGANARKVLKDGTEYCVTPLYISPRKGYQSSMVLYVSYRNGQPKIYVAGLSEGLGRRLLPLRANQLMPAISPQRNRIAFISDITGNPDLFIQDFNPEVGATGRPRQIFTTHQATQGTPAFSPDGNRIAFVSNKDGSTRIYVLDIPAPGVKLSDVKVQLISKSNRESSAPSWSPDGSKLAFCARNPGGDRQIWIYDFETNREKALTSGAGNKENPAWAPDSLHLVYNTTGKNASLYITHLNAAAPVKIEDGQQGEKRFPAWEPRAGT